MVLEETGRNLTASPLYATAVVGASALLLGGSDQQKQALLPELAAGRLTLALALEDVPPRAVGHWSCCLEESHPCELEPF